MKNQNLKKLEEFRIEIRKNHNQKLFEEKRQRLLQRLQSQFKQFQQQNYNDIDTDITQIQQQLKIIIQHNSLYAICQIFGKIFEKLRNNYQWIQKLLESTQIPELIMKIYNNLISKINQHAIKQKSVAYIINIFAQLSKSEKFDQDRIINLQVIEMIKFSFTQDLNILLKILSILGNKVNQTNLFKKIWNSKLLEQLLEMLQTKNANNTLFSSNLMWFLNNFFIKAKQFTETGIKLQPKELNITFDFCQKILSDHHFYIYQDKNPDIVSDAIQVTKILIYNMKVKRYPNMNTLMDILISQNLELFLGRDTIQSTMFIIGHLIYLQDEFGIEIVRNGRFFFVLNKQKLRFKNIWIQIMANLATIPSLHKSLQIISSQIVEDLLLNQDKNERLWLFRYILNWFISKNYSIYQRDYSILEKLSNNHIPHNDTSEEDLFWVKLLNNGYNGPIPQYLISNDDYYELNNYLQEKGMKMH